MSDGDPALQSLMEQIVEKMLVALAERAEFSPALIARIRELALHGRLNDVERITQLIRGGDLGNP